jgi:hypothetical protein
VKLETTTTTMVTTSTSEEGAAEGLRVSLSSEQSPNKYLSGAKS